MITGLIDYIVFSDIRMETVQRNRQTSVPVIIRRRSRAPFRNTEKRYKNTTDEERPVNNKEHLSRKELFEMAKETKLKLGKDTPIEVLATANSALKTEQIARCASDLWHFQRQLSRYI